MEWLSWLKSILCTERWLILFWPGHKPGLQVQSQLKYGRQPVDVPLFLSPFLFLSIPWVRIFFFKAYSFEIGKCVLAIFIPGVPLSFIILLPLEFSVGNFFPLLRKRSDEIRLRKIACYSGKPGPTT